jgi:hypothetical protein
VVSVELQRTPEEISALVRLIRQTSMRALMAEPGATWDRQGREHERLGAIAAVLSWAQQPGNAPPDNPYSLDGVEARVTAAVAEEGPYVTAERVAEIRRMLRAQVRTTSSLWAERAPADTPETRAALAWLLGDPCPVDEHGYTRGYRSRVA